MLLNEQAEMARAMTEKEAAEFLTVTPKTLQCWRWARKGPRYVKLGRRVAYRVSDLAAYLEANAVGTDDAGH